MHKRIILGLCLVILLAAGSMPVYAQTNTASTQRCNAAMKSKVTGRLATAFGVSVQEIANWRCQQHKGIGEIELAYALAKLTQSGHTALTVSQVFDLRAKHQGWGKIAKSAGFSLKDVRHMLSTLLHGTHGKPTNHRT